MSNSIHLHISDFVKVNHEKLTLTLETSKIYRDPVLIVLARIGYSGPSWQWDDPDIVLSLLFVDTGKLWENVHLAWYTKFQRSDKTVTFYFKKENALLQKNSGSSARDPANRNKHQRSREQ